MRIGICTGGGDCPGLNASIRAIVKFFKQASSQTEVFGIHDCFNGLHIDSLSYTSLEYDHVSDILFKGGTILGTINRSQSSVEDQTLIKKSLERIKKGYDYLKLDCLIVIGGEGTHSVTQQLIKHGLNIIGIPKTIDNDLPGTDQTIGFSSCRDYVSESIRRLQSTAESHDRIMILEVMGRDSGFIALHGGLAGGANVILIPEIPFSYEKICNKINLRKKLGRNFSVIVIAEGAFPLHEDEGFGSIGQKVAYKLNKLTHMETRITVLGHLQRGGTPNSEDRLLATLFANSASKLCMQKKFGQLVCITNNQISSISYESIHSWKRKKVSLLDMHLKTAENIGICMGR